MVAIYAVNICFNYLFKRLSGLNQLIEVEVEEDAFQHYPFLLLFFLLSSFNFSQNFTLSSIVCNSCANKWA